MPSSPRTPRHSRHPSSIDASYQYNSTTSSPRDRRRSRSSLHDPATPIGTSFNNHDGLDIGIFSSGGMGMVAGNGMGNLADELADAFSDSGEEGEYYEEDTLDPEQRTIEGREGIDGIRDSGVDVAEEVTSGVTKPTNLNVPSPVRKGHARSGSGYDGSEYGSESDLDSPGIPPSLIARIDAVEALARRGTENNGSPADGVFARVTESLKDLGSQTGVEGSATRLITAHAALTTHLSHQTRQMHNLTFPLLSPLVPPPDPEVVEELLPLLLELSESMPRPIAKAHDSLTALHTLTSDLISSLNYLSDTLHMSRQTTLTATRRLKSAKELVAEMKREEELRDEGERWLTRGNWGERLENRECAGVCGDVVGGFEEVCNGWRARLLEQAGSAPA
ncbi:hypothetical protein VD0002_g4029 [Verticillium dahliae]|uniref:WD domain-containing protein n=2 Tax=Verticillium dahliae TaxID=27337 RepID=G2X3J4_VERDV|nr:uncharacterized protein VDAG_04581 [Verticillium dahliae VdLs.17]KAF3345164.1 Xylosidase/arabinosidase [Verticillium dahliae VDG2]KAH6682422.1 hypothetical protein EV126DRAFT_161121 [Verticillium dahliae]EGY23143.1 hypothetical protein VDAG_04581 [Verticillium dahliae VdLs.17]KAH6689277.1 hypothetical protein EV126DRAFT_117960 [Verticillium dahliae]PNH27108.1 hypothetical protein BJF96_g9591 [Verticillium dahliae]